MKKSLKNIFIFNLKKNANNLIMNKNWKDFKEKVTVNPENCSIILNISYLLIIQRY